MMTTHNQAHNEPHERCDQCGRVFEEHSCMPTASCIHLSEPSDAQVEAAAMALGNLHSLDWSYMSEYDRNWERGDARAALRAAYAVANKESS